jgi:transposase-like protein
VQHRRHTPEQVIRKLREADKLLAEGVDIATVARHHGVSEQTYHRWKNQYGDMKADATPSDSRSSNARTAGSSASWPTRSSTSRCSKRWPRDTSEPGTPPGRAVTPKPTRTLTVCGPLTGAGQPRVPIWGAALHGDVDKCVDKAPPS